MALEMRAACERCGAGLAADGEAYICSHECTFCPRVYRLAGGGLPELWRELVRRPRRAAAGG
jgi:hypothetical protein